MSEELAQVAPATPAAETVAPTTTEQTAEQVVPTEQSVTETVQEPTNEQPAEQVAETSAVETDSAEQAESPKTEEAAAAEQPQVVEVSEDLIERAIALIKRTGKCGSAFLRFKLHIRTGEQMKMLFDKLEERQIIGPSKAPAAQPRDILVPVDPKPPKTEPKKPVEKPTQKKRPMTQYDRVLRWKENMKTVGKYTDEQFMDHATAYALKNPGFNAKVSWSGTLIRMINSLAIRTRDHLRTFSRADADHMLHELMRFANDQPFGQSVDEWNTRYANNFEQRNVVREFFGITGPLAQIPKSNLCMLAVVDSAWPNKMEEERGEGGTFAERFTYLAFFIVMTMNSGDEVLTEGLFANSYHSEPSDAWYERHGGKPDTGDDWIKDGKCAMCGGDVIEDERGNKICSTKFCPHHFAKSTSDTPDSYRHGGGFNRDRRQGGFQLPSFTPSAPQDTRRPKKNWKKNDRRFDDDGGGEMKPRHGKRPPRFHAREEIEEETSTVTEPAEPQSMSFSGGEKPFANNPFADLKLPEPPKEVPVV